MKQCKNKECHSYAISISIESGYCDVCYYKYLLFGLLSTVYEDQEQYIGEYGIDRAVKDAKKLIMRWDIGKV